MESAEIYTAVAARLLDLAPDLSESQRSTVPAPTPEWTVVDTYRHLSGAAADYVEGRIEGRGTPEWTAAQLAARADWTLERICAEWATLTPELAALMAADPGLSRLAVGYWTHEQDIRVAVGVGPLRDDPEVAGMAREFLGGRVQPYAESGAPALRVRTPDGSVDVVLGSGEPALTSTADAFEILRTVTSRRSLRQCLAADWTGGDVAARTAAVIALASYPLPVDDLVE